GEWGQERGVMDYETVRHQAGSENLAPGIDIEDVVIDRFDALLEAGAQDIPFGGGKDARQHVERDEPLLRVRLAVDRKRDADAAEQNLRLAPAIVQHIRWDLG